MAISAAESLMKALKLSSSPEERKQLKAQCGEIMNVADHIKKTDTWIPAKPPSAGSTDERTGQWVAQVAATTASSSGVRDTTTPDPSHQHDSNAKPNNGIYIDKPSKLHVRSSPQPYLSRTFSHSTSRDANEAAPSPAAASQSQIYRLREPISSRELSKREEIILLKASVVNGFKFPPWTKDPPADEFATRDGEGQFTDMGQLSLSPYQQQFFRAWLRAKEAVPPPSYSSNNTDSVGPSMSSSKPLDLVQDAASDCSVVTSLCAAIARFERGHEQVCLVHPQQIPY